ncbi:nematocyst expressed protein 8-like [Rhopilema esculentum]|uniref:nematocyst expressed protein 8-like n=1 Tax=Rhopilema esculentum TaxID=499914 RepID=UPI0031D9E5A0
MLSNCRKSCDKCEEKCKDKDTDCEDWAKQGFCSKSSQWYSFMKDNCQDTCKICASKAEEVKPCKDIEKDCVNWKRAGYCAKSQSFFSFMQKNCMKTCGFCKKAEKDKTKGEILLNNDAYLRLEILQIRIALILRAESK